MGSDYFCVPVEGCKTDGDGATILAEMQGLCSSETECTYTSNSRTGGITASEHIVSGDEIEGALMVRRAHATGSSMKIGSVLMIIMKVRFLCF